MVLAVRRPVKPRQLPRPASVTLDLLCLQSLGCDSGHRPGLHHHLASAGQPSVPRMFRGPALRVVGRADVGALSTGVVDRVGDHAPADDRELPERDVDRDRPLLLPAARELPLFERRPPEAPPRNHLPGIVKTPSGPVLDSGKSTTRGVRF